MILFVHLLDEYNEKHYTGLTIHIREVYSYTN